MEITDEMIKKKHKEFNERIQKVLGDKGGASLSPEIMKLRQLYQMRKPTLERPYGV